MGIRGIQKLLTSSSRRICTSNGSHRLSGIPGRKSNIYTTSTDTPPFSPPPAFGAYNLLIDKKASMHPPNPNYAIPDHIEKPEYAITGIPTIQEYIELKDDPELLAQMKSSCSLAKEILQQASNYIQTHYEQTGDYCTTLDLNNFLHDRIIAANAYPSPLNYMNFPKSICTSVNNVLAHGIPDTRRLADGDIVNVDITVYRDGFHGDTSATLLIGNVDEQGNELVEATREALLQAIMKVGPGVKFGEIGETIEGIAKKYGFGVSKDFCGHGIGRFFHEPPLIPHHVIQSTQDPLFGIAQMEMQPGMTFTIEPIFCQGSEEMVMWKDGWTAVTKDGGRTAQFEHTVAVTEEGVEVLTA